MNTFRYLHSEDYQQRAEAAIALAEAVSPASNKEFLRSVEVEEERAGNLAKVEQATGLRFGVMVGKDRDLRIAGLAKPSERKVFLAEEVLSDEDNAMHVAVHEARHLKALTDIRLEDALGEATVQVLEEALVPYTNHNRISEIDLVEGFTEALTIRSHGEMEGVAYLKKEVPAAEALLKLAEDYGVYGLAEAFDRKDELKFFQLLERLTLQIQLDRIAA